MPPSTTLIAENMQCSFHFPGRSRNVKSLWCDFVWGMGCGFDDCEYWVNVRCTGRKKLTFSVQNIHI